MYYTRSIDSSSLKDIHQRIKDNILPPIKLRPFMNQYHIPEKIVERVWSILTLQVAAWGNELLEISNNVPEHNDAQLSSFANARTCLIPLHWAGLLSVKSPWEDGTYDRFLVKPWEVFAFNHTLQHSFTRNGEVIIFSFLTYLESLKNSFRRHD